MEELAVASILLAAVALISCLSVANKRTIRRMPRAAWVAAILLVPVGGAAAWFLFGRPISLRPSRTGIVRWLTGQPAPTTPVAPDDDADFLRSLDRPADHPRKDDEPDQPPSPAG